MPINETNIKLMASQRLSDTDDGGGRMTGNEIVDGNVNNLFPDISRLDRVYGRVSLRKAFVSVETDDNETYSGSHLVLTNPAKDPLVNVCLFSTSNPHDERTAARDRIEGYVTQGPAYFGWLWGNQLAGSRALLVYQPVDSKSPEVGEVLYLVENEGTGGQYSQYVRITGVETEIITTATISGSATRKIAHIDVGDPLRYTFHGGEITPYDNSSNQSKLYTTTVADAANYFGVMELTQPLTTGDITVNVDSIFTHLVPSAQSEAPLLDLSPGESGPVIEAGASRTVTAPAFHASDAAVFYFGRGMKPGSVVVSGVRNYTDSGDGLLMNGATVAGKISYGLGTITFVGADSWTGSCSVTAVTGTMVKRIVNTIFQEITISNRGYNYTKILNPPPLPGSLIVDYMSQGKWYRLRDKGNGELVSDIASTGTGTINYATGSCLLTCAALPDIKTAVLYGWGSPVDVEQSTGMVNINVAQIDHTVAETPVSPSSMTISWPSAGGTATLTDDGTGTLTGDGTGTVNHVTGRCLFVPTVLPAAGASYTFDYDRYALITENPNVSISGGIATCQLAQTPLKSGSVNFLLPITVGGIPHTYNFTDDGNGNVNAAGWSTDMGQYWDDWDGVFTASALAGTIDYTTGDIVIDMTAMIIDAMSFKPTTATD